MAAARHIDGGPAFPVSTSAKHSEVCGPYGHQDSAGTWQFPGLTIRDYFAAKALQGALSSQEVTRAAVLTGKRNHGGELSNDDAMARACYDMADAMLKARSA
jgi:hypothetical protein